MTLYDRIVSVEEHSYAIITRLEDFKHSFEEEPLRPRLVRNLMELKCWPLIRSNGYEPDESKVCALFSF